jgi:hypothetical protein
MTGAEALTEVRDLVREDTAAFFTDAHLYRCLTGALRKYSLQATYSNHHQYLKSATVTLSSGSSSSTLPNGTLYSSATKCNGHIHRIARSNGNREVPKGNFRFIPGDTGEPSRHRVIANKIQFDREADANYEYTLWYFFEPAAINAQTTAIDFPAGHEYLLCYDAAIKALIKKKTVDLTNHRQERDRLELLFREMLRNRTHGSPTMPPKGLRTRKDGY